MVMKANMEGSTGVVVAEDLSQEEWLERRQQYSAVSRRTKAPLFSCVDCYHPLHPKENHHHTRFFAHNPDAPDTCPLKTCDGESPEHKRLKLGIYRTIKKMSGWDADIEAVAPAPDVATGKPIKVDVTATRQKLAPRVSVPKLQGWEVQLSGIDDGHVLDRQEARDLWLERCTWVTRHRPSWAQLLPWYQVSPATDEHPDLVVDGVFRWEEYGGVGTGGRDVHEPPFPAELMVKHQLRGAVFVQGFGWRLQDTGPTRKRQPPQRRETVKGVVAAYCERTNALPEECRGWSDEAWQTWAAVAREKHNHGEKLDGVDVEAMVRWPELSPPRPSLFAADYVEQLCLLCGQPVVVPISDETPIHHRCAWEASR